MIADIIHLFFLAYTTMIVVRIIGSWLPQWQHKKFMCFIRFYTEPYLGIFRRFIPPIGGMLDLSPVFAFLGLRLMENLILGILQ